MYNFKLDMANALSNQLQLMMKTWMTILAAGLLMSSCSNPGLPGDELVQAYADSFNSTDNELYANEFPNDKAADFMKANIPVFECPDKEFEKTYYFRWWTFRKHIRKIPGGHIITEFLPDVPWAQAYNSISCAAMHHFKEGRWLKEPTYLRDYADFWFFGEGNPRQYSFPAADALWQFYLVTRDSSIIEKFYKPLCENFACWKETHRDSTGLYWQQDGKDGMELSVGGGGVFGPESNGYRATINSYMCADAKALSKMASMLGCADDAGLWLKEAEEIKTRMDSALWDDEAEFYKVMPVGADTLVSCRELHGYTPWVYDIPDEDKGVAWAQLFDPEGFKAPFGPTTAEQRNPGFKLSYEGHECQWNGPSWPYSTSQTLNGMAACIQRFGEEFITREQYLEQLRCYSSSHRLGGVCWIDENINPHTGDWIARTRLMTWENGTWSDSKGGVERGKDYNHSTFCDLVISGLFGVLPQADGSILVSPLIPDEEWNWFCLTGLHCAGHELTIQYDKTGHHYGAGRGYRIFVDGKQVFHSAKPQKYTFKGSSPVSGLS